MTDLSKYIEEFETGNFPITPKENYRRFMLNENPMWMPTNGKPYSECLRFQPRVCPDIIARHAINDAEPPFEYEDDLYHSSWFDLDWLFVPIANGSTVKPGNPKIEDANDWRDLVSMPDVDVLEWEKSAEANKDFLNTDKLVLMTIHTGMWERLISLMDVEGAAVAMIDEDQVDAVKDFFDANTEFLIKYMGKIFDTYPGVDGIYMHDDWGTQNAPFFSKATCEEMLVPYFKRITEYCHSRGKVFDMHSCGRGQDLIECYIETGIDCWCPQECNDIAALAEKTAAMNANICFGYQALDVPEGATDEQIAEAAVAWFDKYKDTRLFNGFRNIQHTDAATKAIYAASRAYYAEKYGHEA